MSPLLVLTPLVLLAAGPELALEPPEARPGDPVRVRWAPPAATASVAWAELLGHRFALPRRPDGYRGWLALPIEAEPGTAPVSVRAGAEQATIDLAVRGRDFAKSRLRVAPRFTQRKRPPALQRRIEAERASMRAVWARPPSPAREVRRFRSPLRGRVRLTGRYGTRRVFNGQTRSRHYGLDFAGPVGRRVYAAAPGEVVRVEDRFYSGRTVVIDHGGGLHSLYFHLSRVEVARGEAVRVGQVIGAVGASGRVTGPHLHLSVAVRAVPRDGGAPRGLYVDPEALLDLP